MNEKLLEFKNLTTVFQTEGNLVKAVDNISFDIQRNQTMALVGESGSGKSVTAMSILQLLPRPQASYSNNSSILFDGKEVIDAPAKELIKIRGNIISMVFQEPMTSLNPVFTCGDQVMEAIMLHQNINSAAAKNLTINLFKEVQLPDPERIFKTYPHQISGGQKQRVMIAMAMSCQPSILIADEPTTALDVTVPTGYLDHTGSYSVQNKHLQSHYLSFLVTKHEIVYCS